MPAPPPAVIPVIGILLVLAIVSSGCTTPAARPQASHALQTPGTSQGTGILHVSSVPARAEVYLDGESWCPATPCAAVPVEAGRHALEFRLGGYEPVTYPVTVVAGGMEGIRVELVGLQAFVPAAGPALLSPGTRPQVGVSGSWSYRQGWNATTTPEGWVIADGPVPLVLHAGAGNTGTGDARDVTASADIYYEGGIVSRHPVDFGPVAAGGHVNRDIPVTCTLPYTYVEQNLVVLVGNVTVTQ